MPATSLGPNAARWQCAVIGVLFSCLCTTTLASGGAAAQASGTPEDYIDLGNPIIVNVFSRDTVHFLKVTTTLKLKDGTQAGRVRTHLPAVRHSLVMLFSDKPYFELTTVAGKTKLRADALETVRKVMKEQTGEAMIDDIFFTSLILQ